MLLFSVAVAFKVLEKNSEPFITVLPDPKWNTKDPMFATTGEAAKYLGVSRQRVHQFIQDGTLRTLNQDLDTSDSKNLSLLERAELFAFSRVKLFIYVEDVISLKKSRLTV